MSLRELRGREPKTETVVIDRENPEPERIARAVAVLGQGGLVAFPTDTVYGLGADALNALAVQAVYRVKKREGTKPLILQVAEVGGLEKLVKSPSEEAMRLIEHFWPGPLTLVLEAQSVVPPEVTGGGKSLGVRVPASRVALSLLRAWGGALTAPSANISGHPSPRTAREVEEQLGGRIAMILDGGRTKVTREVSTILDMTQDPPRLLRKGVIAREEIESVLGKTVEC